MTKPKAKESYIIRTILDVQSEVYGTTIPKGTKGVVVEVYRIGERYGYATDLFVPGGFDENITLEDHQFEVIERHDFPMSSHPEPWTFPPEDNA
jgi:hypothetical protein